jgi:hypothetical protein
MAHEEPSRPDVRKLVEKWTCTVDRATSGHYEAARHLDGRHRFIGLLLLSCSVAATCLAGRAMFYLPIAILDSFMTVFSAMTLAIACAHVFLKDEQRAEEHRRKAARYAVLRRELEQLQCAPSDPTQSQLTDIRTQMADLTEVGLTIPARIWTKTEAKYRQMRSPLGAGQPK